MSAYRIPLRHVQTSEYPSTKRQPSNASSASSGYSRSSAMFDVTRTSTVSSTASSGYGAHRRGLSDATYRAPSPNENKYQMSSIESTPDSPYRSARQSLRPLPQPPDAAPPRERKVSSHNRGKSMDVLKGKFDGSDVQDNYSRPKTAHRPISMILSRADSIKRGPTSTTQTPPSHYSQTPFVTPDLLSLQKSTTSQLRTLSKFAENGSAAFDIKSPDQEVAGLHGRRRLQMQGGGKGIRKVDTSSTGWAGRNWMDSQRQFLQAYEYLCHIGEAKAWIEDILQAPLPPIVQLEEALRDGVTLAEIVAALNPERRIRIFRHQKLQFRHSDNIAAFFRYLEEIELPDLFRFELIDLYEKKNIPKVIYCIHALSWLLFRIGKVSFRIGNLVGQLEFEQHELEAMQKGLDKAGISMPSFGNMGADFGVEPIPEPDPVETEGDRIDRELGEQENIILDLQAQVRGCITRRRLGETMQRLWSGESLLIDLQSRIRADFARQIADYRLNMRRFAINLQSTSRGFLVRQRHSYEAKFWKSREADVLKLQSLARAVFIRNGLSLVQSELRNEQPAVSKMQASIRGFMTRKKQHAQLKETLSVAVPVKGFQAAIRGVLIRRSVANKLDDLHRQHYPISAVQAFARAMLQKTQITKQRTALHASAPIWRALQAVSRGQLTRHSLANTRRELASFSPAIGSVQAHNRAAAVRRNVAAIVSNLQKEQGAIVEIQSRMRADLERRHIAADNEALAAHHGQVVEIQTFARGFLHRRSLGTLLGALETHETGFIQLQSLGRGVLLRNDIGRHLAELEDEEESIIAFQAAAVATLVRANYAEKKRFFKENMEKVVKIQSFVRGKLQGEAYKSLTTGKDPPINTVKNFVHLLNDSDFDFNEEIEFERLRKTVVHQVRQNELAEQYVDQLDIKIALLVKNKITLDEVVKHQRNFRGHSGTLLVNTSMVSGNQFDLKALNKNSRRKLESYQQLFFALQTQPQYLARLFRRVRETGMVEKDCKKLETLMMGLFGYAQKRREEYYLLKLITRSIAEEVDNIHALRDYLRGNFFSTKLLANYTRSPRDRKFLRELLGPLIFANIIEDPALDLESDPMQIYKSAINNEELRTGRPSQRNPHVPREVAIRDPETRDMFIDHLRDLREIADQFLLAMENLVHKMPYGIRFVCQQMFEALFERFPREPELQILQVIGHWLWKFYLQPVLLSPQSMGVLERQLEPLQRRNLGEVAKVLAQVASGRLFNGDDIYLQPLNAYVGESIERINVIFANVISVPDAESTFDIDEFNDLYAKSKPTLYIKMADIFSIHTLVSNELSAICPSHDDPLKEIIHELGSAKNNEHEMFGVSTSEINMTLQPRLHDTEDPEADVKALFMETKRCILYIIRVQSGPNLMEILVRPISREDNDKWHTLLREEFATDSSTRGAYSDANTLVDITSMSYLELKRTALENIMRLEQAGRISRQNHYQDILNAIAVDIRTKSRRRVQRQRELEGVRMTLGNLSEKAEWLESQRKSYDNYIEQAMMTLQKKGKKRFLMPFSKQYNHERELERTGRKPKFGSFKYSARALSDKGVLVSWKNHPDREWDKINITISCDQVGVFFIEGSKGSMQIVGGTAQVPMDSLLAAQFANHQFLDLFEGGEMRLNVNLLLHLIYKKFYRSE